MEKWKRNSVSTPNWQRRDAAETTGWVDHVVTPVGAFGPLVAEDALDRYFVKWVEARTSTRVARASLRLLFNPTRTLSNAVSGKRPWHHRDRSPSWRPASP